MPKHDISEGYEADSNLIDLRDYLRRRADMTARDGCESEAADWEVYRHAEYADGKRSRFSRYNLIWGR
jgi:hypothetical protein